MAHLIMKRGKKEIPGQRGNMILYNRKKYTVGDFADFKKMSRSTMYRRVELYLDGFLNFEDLVGEPDIENSTAKRWTIDGEEWTAKKLSKYTGLSVSAARSRLMSFEDSDNGRKKLFAPANTGKAHNTKGSASFEAGVALAARKKLDDIPGGGSWEKTNLDPTTFFSNGGGNGFAKVHI